jgi:hypothetical protein
VVLSIVERPAHLPRAERRETAIDAAQLADREQVRWALRTEALDRELKFLGSIGRW